MSSGDGFSSVPLAVLPDIPDAYSVLAAASPQATTTTAPTPSAATASSQFLLNHSFQQHNYYSSPPHPQVPSSVQIFAYGFVLVLIPTATILGNVLVIVSVLRFKSLHSAINFLILGLAIADLMVALFVMPYAVYVYVQGGHWLLGPLMCNLYLSSDVACSTASIILLALISFDRYQAINHPIQYSRQAQNISRVVRLFVGVWIYSLVVASPIVLGFNEPPMENGVVASFECRFYSPWFSLLSSLVSFLLPCCVVIFVYLRIIRALRRRERAAKLRKANCKAAQEQQQQQLGNHHHQQQHAANLAATPTMEGTKGISGQLPESEEAGEIVAGPAVNMMMIALPSLNRQIKRYERHKRALEEAALAEDELLSSEDSLSEDVRILTNDFLSEVHTSNSKASASLEPPRRGSSLLGGFRASFSGVMDLRKKSVPAEEIVPSIFAPRKRSACDVGAFSPTPMSRGDFISRKNTAPMKIRMASARDADRNRQECDTGQRARLLSPMSVDAEYGRKRSETLTSSTTQRPATASAAATCGVSTTPQPQQQQPPSRQHAPCRGAASFPLVRRIALGRDIRVNHYLLNDDEDGADLIAPQIRRIVPTATTATTTTLLMRNGGGRVMLGTVESSGDEGAGSEAESARNRHTEQNGGVPGSVSFRVPPSLAVPPAPFRRGSSSIELGTTTTTTDGGDTTTHIVGYASSTTLPVPIASGINNNNTVPNTAVTSREHTHSTGGGADTTPSFGTTAEKSPMARDGTIGSLLHRERSSRRDRHASLRRKVHKSQRKEKRATKTLGIVVGTFLCCWVPFFSLNITNALCLQLDVGWCQIGFGTFFYSTWIGYMNSFMNPVIYTIFNAEFRRAFKSLLLGRRSNAARRI